MRQLVLTFTDGTEKRVSIARLDRDEVDTALDQIASGEGAVLVTDEGPLCIPSSADLRSVGVIGETGDEWLEEREDLAEGLDD